MVEVRHLFDPAEEDRHAERFINQTTNNDAIVDVLSDALKLINKRPEKPILENKSDEIADAGLRNLGEAIWLQAEFQQASNHAALKLHDYIHQSIEPNLLSANRERAIAAQSKLFKFLSELEVAKSAEARKPILGELKIFLNDIQKWPDIRSAVSQNETDTKHDISKEKLVDLVQSLFDTCEFLLHCSESNSLARTLRIGIGPQFEQLKLYLINFMKEQNLVSASEVIQAVDTLNRAVQLKHPKDIRQVSFVLNSFHFGFNSTENLAETIKNILNPDQTYFLFKDGASFAYTGMPAENNDSNLPTPDLSTDDEDNVVTLSELPEDEEDLPSPEPLE